MILYKFALYIGYEEQLLKYSGILHPNHHINIDLKYTLVQLYGKMSHQKSHQVDLLQVFERKKELCLNILEVLNVVCIYNPCKIIFSFEVYIKLLFR